MKLVTFNIRCDYGQDGENEKGFSPVSGTEINFVGADTIRPHGHRHFPSETGG